MAITLVSSASTSGDISQTTPAINTSSATLLVISVASYAGAPTTGNLADAKGNTWTALTARSASSNAFHRFFYAANPVVGTGHTFTVTASFHATIVCAFAGVVTTSPFEAESGANGTSPRATGSLTPSVNGALILSGFASDNVSAIAVSGGLTQTTVPYGSGHNMAGAVGYLVQPSAAAINPSWTWTGSPTAAVALAVFTPSVAAPAAERSDTFVILPV